MPDNSTGSEIIEEQMNHQPTSGEQVQQIRTEQVIRRSNEPHLDLLKVTQAIWLLTGILESLIGIRILLKLIAANPQAGFAQFVYSITGAFLVPFFGLTGTPEAGGSVLELSSLIAMLVYALIAWLIVRVLWLAFAK
jgi:hypothetical protein